MSRTMNADTPIFGELHDELALPEIDVHDFDWHGVEFPTGPTDGPSEPAEETDDASAATGQTRSAAEGAATEEAASE